MAAADTAANDLALGQRRAEQPDRDEQRPDENDAEVPAEDRADVGLAVAARA
jgi:hypothetical protein